MSSLDGPASSEACGTSAPFLGSGRAGPSFGVAKPILFVVDLVFEMKVRAQYGSSFGESLIELPEVWCLRLMPKAQQTLLSPAFAGVAQIWQSGEER